MTNLPATESSSSPRVLRDTRFVAGESHGGAHRTRQLEALVTRAGFCIQDVTGSHFQSPGKWTQLMALIRFRLRHRYPLRPTFAAARSLAKTLLRYQHYLKQFHGARVLVWENANSPLAPLLARDAGFRVIAMPHNIEAFAGFDAEPPNRLRGPDRLAAELRTYAAADAVFTISREECWLLRGAGIACEYLPYYPSPDIHADLTAIRTARAGAVQDIWLMLGSAQNPPTYNGMVEQLQWLAKSGLIRSGLVASGAKLVIAGQQTERLPPELISVLGAEVRGRIDDADLRGLLIRARALLVHQLSGFGALTRIPESLVAGIPVIGNDMACRSAVEFQGVYMYQTPAELAARIEGALPAPPVLRAPADAEERFIATLRRLAGV